MFNKLLSIKTKLVECYQKISYDEDAVEYLIKLVDYMILGSIPITSEILSMTLEEVLVVSTYHKCSELLQIAEALNDLMEEVTC